MTNTRDSRAVVARLAELVSVETPTGDAAAIAAAQNLINSWIAPSLGADGARVDVDGTEHLLWCATGSPHVLLLGHLDTVWPQRTTETRPFTLDGDRATGPGVFDMKAGIVIMAQALARVSRPQHVAVLLTSDEEIGSPTSRALIERLAGDVGAVLVLEPSLDGALKTTRKGGSIYQFEIRGRAAHAGLEPESGRSALMELAHVVLELPRLADADLGTTVNPTVATAGTVTNVIPDHAEVKVDVRAWTMDELVRVDRAMAQLRPATPDVELALTGGINRPPMEMDLSRDLFAVACEAARGLQHPRLDGVAAGGASDGNFTAAIGTPTLDGLGPVGGGAHAVDEWVSIASIMARIELVVSMIDELTQSDWSAPRQP
jgi:glutamate carboxypeptidase